MKKKIAREGFTRTSLVATPQSIPTQEVRVSHDHQVGISVGVDITFLKDQFRPVLLFLKRNQRSCKVFKISNFLPINIYQINLPNIIIIEYMKLFLLI